MGVPTVRPLWTAIVPDDAKDYVSRALAANEQLGAALARGDGKAAFAASRRVSLFGRRVMQRAKMVKPQASRQALGVRQTRPRSGRPVRRRAGAPRGDPDSEPPPDLAGLDGDLLRRAAP